MGVTFCETIDLVEYLLTREEREHKKNVYRFSRYMARLNKHEQHHPLHRQQHERRRIIFIEVNK